MLRVARLNLSAIAVVDQNPGQGFRVELDDPTAFGLGTHQDVGNDRLGKRRVESEAGARIERFDLGDHVGHIGRIDPAQPDEGGDVAGRKERQVIEQSLHCGRADRVAQLQGEAFREIARKDAGRIELLEAGENRFDPTHLALEQLRRAVEPGAQVPRLVEQVQKVQGDYPIPGSARSVRSAPAGARAMCGAGSLHARSPADPRRREPRCGIATERLAAAVDRAVPFITGSRLPMLGRLGVNSPATVSSSRGGFRGAWHIGRRRASSAGSRRSSSGFCWISASTNWVSLRFESCSIFIACCS